jgi:dipeptidyl aminopeptidase/acylaminoacyl peptidase
LRGSILALLTLATMSSRAEGPVERHRFDVRDSIEMTTFNQPSEMEPESKVAFSPDGRHFLVVTSQGLIDANEIRSTLWLYETDTVRSFLNAASGPPALKSRALATVTGVPVANTLDAYSSLITDPRWAPNSRSVYFLGQTASGDRVLYRTDIQSPVTRRVTPLGYSVQDFDVGGGTLACNLSRSANPVARAEDSSRPSRDAVTVAVTGMSLEAILFPHMNNSWQTSRFTSLWVASEGLTSSRAIPISAPEEDNGGVDLVTVSPSGRWVARLLPVKTVPASWTRYEPYPGISYLRIDPGNPVFVAPKNILRLKQYALIDLGQHRPSPTATEATFRLNAPNSRPLGLGTLDRAVWSPNERRVLLTNTFLPLEERLAQDPRRHACVVADIELPSFKISCVAFSANSDTGINDASVPPSLSQVSFGKEEDEVVLEYRGHRGTLTERYRLTGDRWSLASSSVDLGSTQPLTSSTGEPGSGLRVAIRQTLNAPPTLWATDPASGRSKELWNPNPQLARMLLSEASLYRWQDATGFEWTADLIKPVDYNPGERYPLVIQTHGFSEDIFKIATDGAYPTAMAARALASAGVMVLQIPDHIGKDLVTAQEAQRHAEGYVSAIAHLNANGLIDPKKVGIVGFSRTSWYVETALIEHPETFAAATLADGVDESYMQYHYFVGPWSWSGEGEFEKINGGRPFGEAGLRKWMDTAPGFHLDRVQTPLRIEAIGPNSVLREWEIYSSLSELKKPVDMIYFPSGQHVLQKPLERLASAQGNVDWFRFWLQGYEDPAPAKRSQYRRWETLRQPREEHAPSVGSVHSP